MTKASNIFSFRLVVRGKLHLCLRTYSKLYLQCRYVFGVGELLLLDDYQEPVKNAIRPEQEILVRHFFNFGLVPE